MAQTVFVPNEGGAGEPRVAASPDTVKRIKAMGLDVIVEAGAGAASRIVDEEFSKAGATIGKAGDVVQRPEIVSALASSDEASLAAAAAAGREARAHPGGASRGDARSPM
mgnify:CR=1 FL=1